MRRAHPLEVFSPLSQADKVPLVMVTITCNNNGGHPVSMANLREVRRLCDQYKKPLFLDACRFAENAMLIKLRGELDLFLRELGCGREKFSALTGEFILATLPPPRTGRPRAEPEFATMSVAEIVRTTFSLCDGATISAKKDGLVNMGGLLLMRSEELYQKASTVLIETEGFLTYGMDVSLLDNPLLTVPLVTSFLCRWSCWTRS